ncbi:gluconokinase [Alienimonas californiensis]|uniref:Gluconokinase n=1 Tax=Alienimonas californiensis TaxID=2527989 RepID=A0A517P4Q3_9PLAN|nr:gluconokinase, GntK/IdnK-type [Alienimonas californiensis]QDT14368.1 Thermoresistant gluconokinase [Alienimonas californiensis]
MSVSERLEPPPPPAADEVGAVVLAGVSGCGKSTVGKMVARRLGWAFVDGDDLHPWKNVYSMHHGRALTDADRDPWLERCADLLENHVANGVPVILACSALKSRYRRRLRRDAETLLIHLACSREELIRRLGGRTGHFFDPSLLDSQFAALDPPTPGDGTLLVDGDADMEEVTNDIVRLITRPADRAARLAAQGTGAASALPGGGERW